MDQQNRGPLIPERPTQDQWAGIQKDPEDRDQVIRKSDKAGSVGSRMTQPPSRLWTRPRNLLPFPRPQGIFLASQSNWRPTPNEIGKAIHLASLFPRTLCLVYEAVWYASRHRLRRVLHHDMPMSIPCLEFFPRVSSSQLKVHDPLLQFSKASKFFPSSRDDCTRNHQSTLQLGKLAMHS